MHINMRIPLIVKEHITLIAVIEWKGVKHPQMVDFVVDTGSVDSFFSQAEVERLQIPIKNRNVKDQIAFGGSLFNKVDIPELTFFVFTEAKVPIHFNVNLCALKTTKTSEKNKQIAKNLPSIIGLDFLYKHNLSLHFIPSEKIAYLQKE